MVRDMRNRGRTASRGPHHPPLIGRHGSPVEPTAPVHPVPPATRADPPFQGVGGAKFGVVGMLYPTPRHACAWGGYSDLVGRTGSVGFGSNPLTNWEQLFQDGPRSGMYPVNNRRNRRCLD